MTPRIRLAAARDGEALAVIYRPAVVGSVISFEIEPPDGSEMARRVERILARTPWLVLEVKDAVLGYAYAGQHRDRAAYQWSVDVSAYVHPDARRLGIARALYASLFAVLTRQGFRNAYAGITLPNEASVGLHTSVGFTPVGIYRNVGYKLGAWHDTGWFERPVGPHVPEPPAPTPLPQLLAATGLDETLATGLSEVHRVRG